MKTCFYYATGLVLLLGLFFYSEYKKYPATHRYPIKLMTITVDYDSYWNYLTGREIIIIDTYDRRPDTSRLRYVRQTWTNPPRMRPIYTAPVLSNN